MSKKSIGQVPLIIAVGLIFITIFIVLSSFQKVKIRKVEVKARGYLEENTDDIDQAAFKWLNRKTDQQTIDKTISEYPFCLRLIKCYPSSFNPLYRNVHGPNLNMPIFKCVDFRSNIERTSPYHLTKTDIEAFQTQKVALNNFRSANGSRRIITSAPIKDNYGMVVGLTQLEVKVDKLAHEFHKRLFVTISGVVVALTILAAICSLQQVFGFQPSSAPEIPFPASNPEEKRRREKRFLADLFFIDYRERSLLGVLKPWQRVKAGDISGKGLSFYSKRAINPGKSLSIKVRFLNSDWSKSFISAAKVVYSKSIPLTREKFKVGVRFNSRKFTINHLLKLTSRRHYSG